MWRRRGRESVGVVELLGLRKPGTGGTGGAPAVVDGDDGFDIPSSLVTTSWNEEIGRSSDGRIIRVVRSIPSKPGSRPSCLRWRSSAANPACRSRLAALGSSAEVLVSDDFPGLEERDLVLDDCDVRAVEDK